MKSERVKKIVGNLLTKWSVTDADKVEFLKELEEKFAEPGVADEEDLEPITEDAETEKVEEELPNEEVGEEEVEEVSEDAEVPAETEPAEEVAEPTEEPVAKEPQAEVPSEEPLPEQPPVEENPMEQPVEQPQEPTNDPKYEEMSKTIEGLLDRISSLEDLVKKLGAPVEESVGVEPHNPSGESLQESEMDRINRLRMGR